jgi:hypothetical protein
VAVCGQTRGGTHAWPRYPIGMTLAPTAQRCRCRLHGAPASRVWITRMPLYGFDA